MHSKNALRLVSNWQVENVLVAEGAVVGACDTKERFLSRRLNNNVILNRFGRRKVA